MNSWERVCIANVCESIVDCINKTAPIIDEPSPFKMIRTTNIRNGRVNLDSVKFVTEEVYRQWTRRQIPRKGDILLTREAPMGEVGMLLTDDYVFLGQRIVSYRTNPDYLDNKFLLYAFQSDDLQNQIKAYASGSTVQHMRVPDTKALQIPVPPLPEQKRIVAILDEAFEGIDRAIANTEKNLANSRELFESYRNFKLLAVASSKPTQTLSCITELIIDCEHKTAPTQETGIASIRTPNIGKGYLIFNNVNRVSEETYELWTRRGKPESGDLILAREAPAGNVGVIPPNTKVCLGQRTVLIRPNKESVDSQYLAFLLLHPFMQKRLLSKSTGATVQHVNMKDIRELAISQLPAIQAQRACIKELEQLQSQVNRLKAIYCQKIAALKELKQSILQKAFTGELTADTLKTAKEEIAA